MGPILHIPAVLERQQNEQKESVHRDDDDELTMREYLSFCGSTGSGCSVCHGDDGGFIECARSDCFRRFHVLCGWFNGQSMSMAADDSGRLLTTAFCSEHSEAERGVLDRDLKRFGMRRARGLTERVSTARIHRRERVLDLVAEYLESDGARARGHRFDLSLPERCAVCFGDESGGDELEMRQCINCRIWVHCGCYLQVR